jgi:hypothetical protein
VFEVTVFAELLGRARELLESNQPVLVEAEVKLENDMVKVLAASFQAVDQVLGNGSHAAMGRIEIRLDDAAAAPGLCGLLGPSDNGSRRVRLVVPLDRGEEVAIDLSDAHRLTFGRRVDLERCSGVIGVVDP